MVFQKLSGTDRAVDKQIKKAAQPASWWLARFLTTLFGIKRPEKAPATAA